MNDFEDSLKAIKREMSINQSDIEDYQAQVDELKGEISVKEDELRELEDELHDLETETLENPTLELLFTARFQHLISHKAEHTDYAISRLPHELMLYDASDFSCIVVMGTGGIYAGPDPYPSPDDEMILVAYEEGLYAQAEVARSGEISDMFSELPGGA